MIRNQKKLDKHMRNVYSAVKFIFKELDETLSDPAKSFTVHYDNKILDFHCPSTKDEFNKMKADRADFISYFMNEALEYIVQCQAEEKESSYLDAWRNIMGIMNGADIRDHQFEKYEVVDDGEGSNVEVKKSVALDMNNYQVKENLGLLDEEIN